MELELYSELASWWPLMSSPDDYEEEAGFHAEVELRALPARGRLAGECST